MRRKRLINDLYKYYQAEDSNMTVPSLESLRAYKLFESISRSVNDAPKASTRKTFTRRAVVMAVCLVLCVSFIIVPLSLSDKTDGNETFNPTQTAQSTYPNASATPTIVTSTTPSTLPSSTPSTTSSDKNIVVWDDGTIKKGLQGTPRVVSSELGTGDKNHENLQVKQFNDRVYFSKPYYDYVYNGKFDFFDQFRNADDDTIFALNVQFSFSYEERKLINANCSFDKVEEAKQAFDTTQEGIFNRLKKSLDLNNYLICEATKDEDEYIKAKNSYYDEGLNYIKTKLRFETELKKEALEFLYEKCESVLFDGNTDKENEAVYLANTASLAVVIISKKQIRELENGRYIYNFNSASENYANAGLNRQEDDLLVEGTKMTQSVKEAFDEAGKGSVTVKVYYYLRDYPDDEFSEKYDDDYQIRWNRVLSKYGMTLEEYRNNKNIDNETHWQIQDDMHEYLNRHKETDALLNSIFCEGEISYSDTLDDYVTANITLERAIEISKTWEIGVICLPSEQASPYLSAFSFVKYQYKESTQA